MRTKYENRIETVKKVVDLYSASTQSVSKALRYSTHCQGITQFYTCTQAGTVKFAGNSTLYDPYLSASEVVFYEGALYQVYVPLPLPLPYVSSASGMSYTCLFLPSRSWYSFTDPGRMEG